MGGVVAVPTGRTSTEVGPGRRVAAVAAERRLPWVRRAGRLSRGVRWVVTVARRRTAVVPAQRVVAVARCRDTAVVPSPRLVRITARLLRTAARGIPARQILAVSRSHTAIFP